MKRFRKQFYLKTILLAVGFFAMVAFTTLEAQENQVKNAYTVNNMEDQHMEYSDQLKEIINKYPAFAFKYSV